MLVTCQSHSNVSSVRPLKLISCLCQQAFLISRCRVSRQSLHISGLHSLICNVRVGNEELRREAASPGPQGFSATYHSHFTDRGIKKAQDFFWKLGRSKSLEKCSQLFLAVPGNWTRIHALSSQVHLILSYVCLTVLSKN